MNDHTQDYTRAMPPDWIEERRRSRPPWWWVALLIFVAAWIQVSAIVLLFYLTGNLG
jgi:hypothetical protein